MKKILSFIICFILVLSLTNVAYAQNLVKDGSFEDNPITNSSNWEIFDVNGPWYTQATSGTPDAGDPVGLELQKSGLLADVNATNGDQYAELDAFYPLKLYQNIKTCQSGKYKVSFDYAPRPNVAENHLVAKFGSETLKDTGIMAAPPAFVWTHFEDLGIDGPKEDTIEISFTEMGSNDQLGMFLDNVSVECVNPPDDNNDLCPGTIADKLTEELGVNRWIWNGKGWITQLPKGKGKAVGPQNKYDMVDTFGCSCNQILDKINGLTGDQLEGHYKFGCSKSILDEFISDVSDGEFDGYNINNPMETVEVLANKSIDTISESLLSSEDTYLLRAHQTADAGDTIDFDAICSKTNRITGDSWTDLVSGYESYGETLLELNVDETFGNWGTECNVDHEYRYELTGMDKTISFGIYDIYYPNNKGSLFVDIYQRLY